MYYSPGPPQRTSPSKGLLVGLGAAGAIALILIFVFVASRPEPRFLPARAGAFSKFVSDGKSFACAYPSDWIVKAQYTDTSHQHSLFMPDSPIAMKMYMALFSRADASVTITS